VKAAQGKEEKGKRKRGGLLWPTHARDGGEGKEKRSRKKKTLFSWGGEGTKGRWGGVSFTAERGDLGRGEAIIAYLFKGVPLG